MSTRQYLIKGIIAGVIISYFVLSQHPNISDIVIYISIVLILAVSLYLFVSMFYFVGRRISM